MNIKIGLRIFLLLTLINVFYLFNTPVIAETNSSAEEIVNALNLETETYDSYGKFSEEISSIDQNLIMGEFNSKNDYWKSVFTQVTPIYEKYSSDFNSDQTLRNIAIIALSGNQKAIEATVVYQNLFSDTLAEAEYDQQAKIGDQLMQEAVTLHDEAVDKYNDYTGASSQLDSLYFLYFSFFISLIFSIILWFKSRTKSIYQADIIKAQIFKNLLKSSLWLLISLIVTLGTLQYALSRGGDYYIFYGPMFVGGWQMLSGFWRYFTRDRKIIKGLKRQNSEDLLSKTLIG